MKKTIVFMVTFALLITLLAGCSTQTSTQGNEETTSASAETADATVTNAETAATNDDQQITIGVSIWSISDSLGSEVKAMIDEAAKLLNVKMIYVETGLKSEAVIASVENLCAAGVDGILIVNGTELEMAQVIPIAQENEVYIAQFFRIPLDEDVNKVALENSYYLGCTHEDEQLNGYTLCNILIQEKGSRKIGVINAFVGDTTENARLAGYKQATDEWNAANPNDQVTLMDAIGDKSTAELSRQAAEGLIDANPDMDAIAVLGGGGSPLDGVITAIDAKGKTGEINVVSTDFPDTLGEMFEKNQVSVMSGGHFADPMFSFMMVYNAVKGNYNRTDDAFLEVKFNMMYVSSLEQYQEYEKYFIDSFPYSDDELIAMANGTFEELQATAAALSIEDAKNRHEK